jgi:hypothetical protein
MENMKLKEETARAKGELKMIRLEHQELVSKGGNLSEDIQSLHDQYISEI